MTVLNNDAFLTRLTRIFEDQKKLNSKKVYLTMKRHSWKSKKQIKTENTKESKKQLQNQDSKEQIKEEDDCKEYPLLLRATCGKTKIITYVNSSDSDKFYTEYSNILKVYMATMKKKERKKEKAKKEMKKIIHKVKATTA
ncbi:hypothetical protein Glove_22g66 [Diversispora epigaea]|uniref:Signal recognition particle subunit SRP14 n=1 Tax=Diversispora epigaea TaxID=1348612 RepID=A0A397JVK7_9GLOM|nr:hypothetical protein Glove_22g66 [Diversispora epigaea]